MERGLHSERANHSPKIQSYNPPIQSITILSYNPPDDCMKIDGYNLNTLYRDSTIFIVKGTI